LKKRFQDKITHLPEEIIEGIIDKWDNKINSDLTIDTSNGISKEDIENVIKLIKND
jgi:hypothetical protein